MKVRVTLPDKVTRIVVSSNRGEIELEFIKGVGFKIIRQAYRVSQDTTLGLNCGDWVNKFFY